MNSCELKFCISQYFDSPPQIAVNSGAMPGFYTIIFITLDDDI